MVYQPIENYGIIGDMNTVALVGMNGSIDFMCYPDFDSPSIFAALLDSRKGGSFSINAQMHTTKYKQIYLPDTNVLISRFLAEEGLAEIVDFMPVTGMHKENCLIRRVTCVRGNNTFTLNCAPRFNYGRTPHKTLPQIRSIFFIPEESGYTALKLISSVNLQVSGDDALASFTLKPGESASFMLTSLSDDFNVSHLEEHVEKSLFETINFWRKWISASNYRGRWQEAINRSALVLKLLSSRKYGSLVASATFSLPEQIGGNKNWDYRYMWIRDAAFSLYALIRLGFTKEATHFIDWIQTRCPDIRKPGELGLMYSIRGERYLKEFELEHFEGYMRSKPVRIGNAAYNQLQLDIYGELIDSIYLYNKYGESISFDLWEALSIQINWLADHWNQPDEGIWEVREGRQYFLYTRLMCWVAFDRMLRMARYRSFPSPIRWKEARDEIYKSIFTDFWNPELKSFVQYKGSSQVDASTLLMPLTRFIGAKDPRWLSTLEMIEKQLVRDSLVYRYRMPDATEEDMFTEGTFSLCSFWYVESLSRAGQLEKARYYFEKMLSYANHLGLYAEQIGLQGEHLGNFPQAFTHLGLISAAYNLNQNLSDARNKQI